jgi:hypothetical protein
MDKNNVVYIKVKPYSIELPITTLTSRFCNNLNCNIPFYEFNKAITEFFKMNTTMIGGQESNNSGKPDCQGQELFDRLKRFLS